MVLVHWPPRHRLVSTHSSTSVLTHTQTSSVWYIHTSCKPLGLTSNLVKFCHLDEELPDHSEHVRKVMHHQQVMTCSCYTRSYCAGTDDCENDCMEIINFNNQGEPPTVLYLHMRAHWVPRWNLGHRTCTKRRPLYWCKHPWGTHLVSGTHRCLGRHKKRLDTGHHLKPTAL